MAKKFIDVGVEGAAFESSTVSIQDGTALTLTNKVRVLWDDTVPNVEVVTTLRKLADTINQRTG